MSASLPRVGDTVCVRMPDGGVICGKTTFAQNDTLKLTALSANGMVRNIRATRGDIWELGQ